MKKIILCLALAFAGSAFAGVGATTNWVARYVQEYVANAISNSTGEVSANTSSSTTGEVTTVTSGTSECPIILTITNPSVAALYASACDSSVAVQGITNGTTWAWNDSTDRYEHSGILPIVPSATNFTWNAIGSTSSDTGEVLFKQGSTTLFKVNGKFVTESEATQIRGN